MSDPIWSSVEEYFERQLLPSDPVLEAALEASTAAGLPPIQVSASQGKLLHLLALAHGSRRILEVGTLGGYSTLWLARALPSDGHLITLELEPRHAEGVRRMTDWISREPRLSATVIQTVGDKGYDGFLLARVQ